jgi:hypothetical protein
MTKPPHPVHAQAGQTAGPMWLDLSYPHKLPNTFQPLQMCTSA